AEPGILGINAGSGFAIALFIVVGQVNADNFVYVLPIISMIGGILTALVIFSFSYNKGEGITPASMVLVGVGMATALSGGSLTLMSTFDEDQSEFIASWLAGNVWGDEWAFVIAFLPWVIVLIPFLLLKANVLNLLNTHQHIAQCVCVNIGRMRVVFVLRVLVLSSAAVYVAVAIGLRRLLDRHIAKSIVVSRQQMIRPISISIGPFLLVLRLTPGQGI